MAYREPSVTTFEVFEEAVPALALFDLPNVVVGPAFQVVSDDSVGTYTGISADYSYESQLAGTFIDTRNDVEDLINYPVTAYLKNAVVRTQDVVSTGVISALDLNKFNDPAASVFANVKAGDVIVITGSGAGNNGSYTVRQKIDNNNVKINETFAAAETGVTYTVRRNLGSSLIDVTEFATTINDIKVTLGAAIAVPVEGYLGDKDVLSAEVHLKYRALRIEQSADVKEYKTVSELQADFGIDQIVPENPVVFGVNLALQQAVGASSVHLLELQREFLTLPDELLAYQKAFDVLSNTDMYAISALTFNVAVHQALKSHAEAMSAPEIKLERVGLGCRKIVLTATVVDEATTSASDGFTATTTFKDANANFITDGVVPGHYILVTSPSGAVGRWKIASVDSETQVTTETGPSGGPYNTVTYTVDKDLTLSEQAATLKAYAQSIGSRRFVLVWPDEVEIPVGNTPRALPGYFLTVAVGALTTILPTQQGFTNRTVSVYSKVVHSTKYFNREQLNIIADGGYMIFVQDELGISALKIRHQLTTDRSSVKFQEYSITKNVDFISKFIRDSHRIFPGDYNIVDNLFDDLKTLAHRTIGFLRDDTKKPRIGGVIKNGRLVSMIQDPNNIDGVQEKYKMDIPIPLNNLDITISV